MIVRVIVLLAGVCLAATGMVAAQDIAALLPDSLEQWQASGLAQVFVGDDLFMYIDGGAEIYLEYGFDRVAVRDYERGEDVITIEIYRMTEGAFGIYSFVRTAGAQLVELNCGGALTEYFLVFWAGDDMVVVTAQTDFDEAQETVRQLGSLIAESLTAQGSIPAILSFLPDADRVAGSEKYFKGLIGMQNYAHRMSRMLIGFEEACAAKYAQGEQSGRLLLLSYADPQSAQAALEGAVGRSERVRGVSAALEQDRLVFTAEDGSEMTARRGGSLVAVSIDAPFLDLKNILDSAVAE